MCCGLWLCALWVEYRRALSSWRVITIRVSNAAAGGACGYGDAAVDVSCSVWAVRALELYSVAAAAMESGGLAASRLFLPRTAAAVAVGAGEELVLEDVDEPEIESESGDAERSAGSSGGSGVDLEEEEVRITGFGTLAQQRAARRAQERRAGRGGGGGGGDDGAGDSAAPHDADARVPAAGLGVRAAAVRASGSHLSQRMPRQPTASSDGRRHRRKKNKGGSWTRSALESRAAGTGVDDKTALPASASASLDLSRTRHETALASRLSDADGRDSGDEGGRQEAGVFEGMLGGVRQAHAKRLPFGATEIAHRRRGGQRAGAARLRTPRGRAAQATQVGGSDVSAVDHTDVARWSASPQDRCDPPAAGFAVLSDSQLGALRAMFDAVDWCASYQRPRFACCVLYSKRMVTLQDPEN